MLTTSVSTLITRASVIVFDLDGTLVDTLEDLAEALDSALLENGLSKAPRSVLLSQLHLGLEASARTVLQWNGVDASQHSKVVDDYMKHYVDRAHRCSHLYAGVEAFLSASQQRGQALAVCTNKSHEDAAVLLSLLGITDRFNLIVGIDTCGTGKPDPQPLLWTLECLGCLRDQALFIGDSLVDAECAARAGVEFLLHGGGYGAGEVVQHLPGVYRFHGYEELDVEKGLSSQSGAPEYV
ncbi:phosphoglycolate phosphatase [Hydrogenophaga palleronii]|uniref:phosphoglycolate phosphatase n=1 Tax=Hydrogenophaga palleronii TaxID=65655 RepID=A0ABU1WU83_9BURK|nr:HAD-IA family hydrolase [Hydrogenophaga palleronii]MDR7152880.1 phosphoglycolate phosphatase [Hydrogenophaga palleronii]